MPLHIIWSNKCCANASNVAGITYTPTVFREYLTNGIVDWHMGLLSDTPNWGLRMCRECRERFSRHGLQGKPLVSDPGMHHGTCVTHVPWCMSRSLTCGGGENVPGIPGACATPNFTYLVRGPLRPMWRHMASDISIIIVLRAVITTSVEPMLISRLVDQYEQTPVNHKSKYDVFFLR